MVVFMVKNDDGHMSMCGWHTTDGVLEIKNDSSCKLVRGDCVSEQMEGWEEGFPEEIPPQTTVKIDIKFVTRPRTKFDGTSAECNYAIVDPRSDTVIADFNIWADAWKSSLAVFEGLLFIKWGSLPNVFGMQCTPLDGKIGFKHNKDVGITISGSPLPVADRVDDAEGKKSAWMSWEELVPDIEVGDIISADRGPIMHYGIVEKIDAEGVHLGHLNGTAGALLRRHPYDPLRQTFNALRKNKSGDIAEVGRVILAEFSNGDPCRIDNAYDHKLQPFPPAMIQQRINQTVGHRDYSLWEFNCEHFAHLMRYGVTYSGQVEELQRLSEKLKVPSSFGEELMQRSISFHKEIMSDAKSFLRSAPWYKPSTPDGDGGTA